MNSAEVTAIVAALVGLIGAVTTAAVTIINALKGHGTIVAANTEATNTQTAVLRGTGDGGLPAATAPVTPSAIPPAATPPA